MMELAGQVANMNLRRNDLSGAGESNTSALAFGGENAGAKAETESWNGTNWTEVNNLNAAKFLANGIGTQTSALSMGGIIPTGSPADKSANTELWNGTNWTEVNNLNTERRDLGASGPDNTNALAFGGNLSPGNSNATESWNGTSWTTLSPLNTARMLLGGAGTSTSSLAFGGFTPAANFTNTELWDGSTWTETTDLSVALLV